MWGETQTLATAGVDITFNGTSGDIYHLDPTQCAWTIDTRIVTDDTPLGDGVILFPPRKGAGHLRLGGMYVPADGSAAARDTMEANLRAACDALFNTDGTYQHPDRGNLAVRCETYPVAPGAYLKEFVLVLIAPDPGGW